MGSSIDREKVIKELSELHGSKETMEIIEQAIALLKEQEARKKNRLPYSPDSNVQWT